MRRGPPPFSILITSISGMYKGSSIVYTYDMSYFQE